MFSYTVLGSPFSFFLLFYSLNGLNMTYITVFNVFFYTVPVDKITQKNDANKNKHKHN